MSLEFLDNPDPATTNPDMELKPTSFLPDLRKCAILLDIDGTILDFAPSPRQVRVPVELRQTLTRLNELTGGALALVTGALLTAIAFRVLIPALAPAPETAGLAAAGLPTGNSAASGAK